MKEFIGHYKVVGELGRGGMGVVYKAHDDALNRDVAIKVLSEQLATDEAVVERFKREAKSMGALNDHHIIQIYYIGEDQGAPYFVMEFVDGESLSQRLKREGRLPVAEARRILSEAVMGLATAHGRGVIHRDVKPGNLMLARDGTVKIADFGIAMVQDYSKRLTNTGEFVGTPGYLSPEVCVGQAVDHRSDIFALGIVFYEMLTGDIPFTEASPLGMMLEVVKAEIPDVRSVNHEVDERTCAILKNMIAKDPAKRYQSCRDLLADLAGEGPVASPAAVASSEFASAATVALSQLEALPEEELRTKPMAVSTPTPQGIAPTDNKRSRVPLAIAALVVIGIAAGAGYEYRDRLFGNDGGDSSIRLVQAADSAGAGSPETDKPAAQSTDASWTPGELFTSLGLGAAEPAAAGDPGGDPDAGNDAGYAGGQGSGGNPQDLAGPGSRSMERGDPVATAGDGGKLVAAAGETKNAALAETQAGIQGIPSALETAATETRAGLSDAEAGLQEAQASLQALQALSAATGAQAATGQPLQVAIAKPPAVSAPPPGPPRVVVVAVGDRAIAGPVEQMLEEALVDSEHLLMDEGFFPDIGRYAGVDHIDLPGLSELIRENGGDILVLAEVDYLGETPLEYYGQYSTLYSVNVKVRNILLSERRPVGRGWLQKVDFTTLNAADKAREAIQPILGEFTASLSDYKAGG